MPVNVFHRHFKIQQDDTYLLFFLFFVRLLRNNFSSCFFQGLVHQPFYLPVYRTKVVAGPLFEGFIYGFIDPQDKILFRAQDAGLLI